MLEPLHFNPSHMDKPPSGLKNLFFLLFFLLLFSILFLYFSSSLPLLFSFSRLFFSLFLLQTFFLYFLKDIVQMADPEAGVTLLSSVAQLSAALSAYPVGLLSDRLGSGRKKFIYLACAILALGNWGFLFARSILSVCVISGIIGIGNGGYLAMDSALAIDTLPDAKEAARFLGIWGVASFIGTALGPLLVSSSTRHFLRSKKAHGAII